MATSTVAAGRQAGHDTYRNHANRPDMAEHSRIGTTWVALGAFLVVLILLAVFILQNSNQVRITYFGASGTMSFGVAMLLSAIAGSLLTLLIGSARILQLKMKGRRVRSEQMSEPDPAVYDENRNAVANTGSAKS